MLDRVVEAAKAQRRGAFDASTNPGGGLDLWYTSIGTLPWQTLTFAVDGPLGNLVPSRQAQLPSDAQLRAVTLRWQLTGDASPSAEHTLWLTTASYAGIPRLYADSDLPAATPAPSRPVWLSEAVAFRHDDSTTGALVARAGGSPGADWARFGRIAAANVIRLVAPALRHSQDGLLLQVPSSQTVFERCLGVAPGTDDRLAAAAWPMGPQARAAAVQVVVNPRAVAEAQLLDRERDPTAQALQILLTHEAVHVALHSPGSSAALWLVEGYADHIAYRAYPAGQSAAAAGLLAAVRAGRSPAQLPADRDFAGDDLDQTYAQAWTACRYLAAAYGEARLAQFYAAADRGDEIESAARSALGVDLATLTRGWQADLKQLAADPPW